MPNHIIELKPYAAHAQDITSRGLPPTLDNCVRTYKYSPTSVALQIRTTGPIGTDANPGGRGAKIKHMYSHALLSKAETLELIAALQAAVAEVVDEGHNTQARIHAALCQ